MVTAGLESTLRTVLETGTKLVKVDAKNTTQTCSRCGQVKEGDERLGLSERTFFCSCCGLSVDRDLNAAKNILSRAGLARSYACGDDVRLPSKEAVFCEAGTIYSDNRGVGSLRLYNRGRMSQMAVNMTESDGAR